MDDATAQALTNAANAFFVLLNTPWAAVLKYAALGLVGLLLVPTYKQHLIELVDQKFKLPIWAKASFPLALSLVTGQCLRFFGADNNTALAAAGIWATLTHLVNESPLALDLSSKLPASAVLELKNAAAASKVAPSVRFQ